MNWRTRYLYIQSCLYELDFWKWQLSRNRYEDGRKGCEAFIKYYRQKLTDVGYNPSTDKKH